MATVTDVVLRRQLTDRKQRLQTAIRTSAQPAPLVGLLREVDSALERMDAGTYGLCQTCHDPIEENRLAADPLARFCLDHLTPGEQRALEQDLELAARIQRSLLPRPDRAFGGWEVHYRYEPAGPVSGDYCDVVLPEREDGPLFFALGDISGKGVSASLLMSHLQAIFRSLLATHASLEGLVEQANRLFCEGTLPTHYATLVCGSASPAGWIELCNAGHCPPLLLQGSRVESIPATGLPVGLFASGSFPVQTLRLDPGDVLLLYTDGLSEAQDGKGAEYGLERAHRVLADCAARSADQVTRAYLDDLRGFVGGGRRRDDLTVMAIRRAP